MAKFKVIATRTHVYEVEVDNVKDEYEAYQSLDDWISDDFEPYETDAKWEFEYEEQDGVSEAPPKVESATTKEFAPCADCGATDMDEYTCPDQQEFCLDCCGCPEHIVDEHNPSWRD